MLQKYVFTLNKTSINLEKLSLVLKKVCMAKSKAHTPAGERVEQLRKYLGLSYAEIAQELGKKSGQSFYDIMSGRHGVSQDLATLISERWPEISREWLLFGTGNMIPTPQQNQVSSDGSVVMSSEVWGEMKKMIATLQSQQDTIKMLSEAVARGGESIPAQLDDAGCAGAV